MKSATLFISAILTSFATLSAFAETQCWEPDSSAKQIRFTATSESGKEKTGLRVYVDTEKKTVTFWLDSHQIADIVREPLKDFENGMTIKMSAKRSADSSPIFYSYNTVARIDKARFVEGNSEGVIVLNGNVRIDSAASATLNIFDLYGKTWGKGDQKSARILGIENKYTPESLSLSRCP